MEMEELNEWVNAYIEVHKSENSSNEDHSCYWAIEKIRGYGNGPPRSKLGGHAANYLSNDS